MHIYQKLRFSCGRRRQGADAPRQRFGAGRPWRGEALPCYGSERERCLARDLRALQPQHEKLEEHSKQLEELNAQLEEQVRHPDYMSVGHELGRLVYQDAPAERWNLEGLEAVGAFQSWVEDFPQQVCDVAEGFDASESTSGENKSTAGKMLALLSAFGGAVENRFISPLGCAFALMMRSATGLDTAVDLV